MSTNFTNLSGSISSGKSLTGSITQSGGGTRDHDRLINRDLENQHPIEAITGLRDELNGKLDSETAQPLIEEALKNKAKGLYFDAKKEFSRKSYWYLTSEIDPRTKQGIPGKNGEYIISGPYDLGAGGGSGGGVTSVSVKAIDWPSAVSVSAEVKLRINWTSTIGEDKEPTGNGTVYLSVNGKQINIKSDVPQGVVEFDITGKLVSGDNTIQVKVLDAYGTTGLLVKAITAVDLKLISGFSATRPYTGTIFYYYIPIGDVEKTVHFLVDDSEIGTQTVVASGESQTFEIKNLTHGSHKLEVYFDATISGLYVRSESLIYDLIYYEVGNTTPIIASAFSEFNQTQYIPFTIPYLVYIYGKNTYQVSLSDGVETKVLTVDGKEHYWEYRPDKKGSVTLSITCGETVRSFNIEVAENKINVTPVSSDLVVALSAMGRSNDEDPEVRNQWIYNNGKETVTCDLTNFNFKSDGWVKDSDSVSGNTVLRLSGDARLQVNYKLFETDFKNTGKTIEFEIATRDIRDYDAVIISCVSDDTRDSSASFSYAADYVNDTTRGNIFIATLNHDALVEREDLVAGNNVFTYKVTDETKNDWYFNNEIVNLADYGIEVKPAAEISGDYILPGDTLTIIKVVSKIGLEITPQVASFRSAQSYIYTQYKEDEHIRISFVVEKNDASTNNLIWMYVDGIASAAVKYSPSDKFNQNSPAYISIGSNEATVDIYNIRIYDNNLTSQQIVNNWIADIQNMTEKTEYYLRNDNYASNVVVANKLPAGLPYIVWDINPLPEYKGDKRPGNVEYVDTSNPDRSFTAINATYNVQGTSSAVYPTKNIRIKYKKNKDWPEAEFTWLDQNEDDITEYKITDGGIGDNYFTYKVDYASSEGANNVELTRLYNDVSKAYGILTPPQKQDSRVRVGVDGFPIAAFQRVGDFNKFITKANFNNDKANEKVYGFADGDESWEITNNSANEAKFKTPVDLKNFSNAFEIRFPDQDQYGSKEDGSELVKLKAMSEWVYSTYTDLATNESLPEPVTYRYENIIAAEDGTFSTIKVEKTFDRDTAEYRLNKFKAELPNYFNVNSTVFYYLFTQLFLMVDSRAKNCFPTYFASREEGDGGDHWFWLPYDMDTAIGIDNNGRLSFDYSLEDTDEINGAAVFNGQDSVMWNNLRIMFNGEIAKMYAELRALNLLTYEVVDGRFTEHQNKWSENIFNEDAKNKYVTPLAKGDNYLEMLQGAKKQQRRWWLYNRFKYIDSKYNAGDARKDFIQFRAYVNANIEKPDLTIVPYADIYATVSFANSADKIISVRAKRGVPTIIKNPFTFAETETDQETYIYSASQLKSIGDLSGFYPKVVKVGNATKLQELKIGDSSETYNNANLTELTLGANTLLRTLDVRNCTSLAGSIDLSGCTNIEEVYFSGTRISGIDLPDGGILKILHLPGTIQSLTLKNQKSLTDLSLAGTKNIQELWLENIPSKCIKAVDFVKDISAGSKVRMIGIDETVPDLNGLKEFYAKLETLTGLDAEGNAVDIHNAITGTITVTESLSYADWCDYKDKFGEITIKAEVICTVTFYDVVYDGAPSETTPDFYHPENVKYKFNARESINITKGSTITETIEPGVKPKNKQYTYNFSNWYTESGEFILGESGSVVDKNLDIYPEFTAKARTYTVELDKVWPVAEWLTTDKITQEVKFGEYLSYPEKDIDLTWPSDYPNPPQWTGKWYYDAAWVARVDFTEPFNPRDNDVETYPIYLRWIDEQAPEAHLEKLSFKEVKATAYDSVGIVKYLFTNKPESEWPTEWIQLEAPVQAFDMDFAIDTSIPGPYTFKVADGSGNETSPVSINTIEIVVETDENSTEGIAGIELTEYPSSKLIFNKSNGHINIFPNTDIIFNGTLVGGEEGHYQNLEFKFTAGSGPVETYRPGDRKIVSLNSKIVAVCEKKSYLVKFDTGGQGTIPKDQYVKYNELVIQPDPQLIIVTTESGTTKQIISKWTWADESTGEIFDWNFETNTITGNITLNAVWTPYSEATKITITTTAENQEITLRYYQSIGSGVWVRFQENGAVKSSEVVGYVTLTNTYANIDTYTIELGAGAKTTYSLGSNSTEPCLSSEQSFTIENIKFSWDVGLEPYAFSGIAGLTEIILTDFITKLPAYAFYECTNLKYIYFGKQLKWIAAHAFENSGITASYSYTSGEYVEDTYEVLAHNYEKENAPEEYMSVPAIILPEKLTYIDNEAFRSCKNLKCVIMADNVIGANKDSGTTASGYTFEADTQLLYIKLSESLTRIDRYSFNLCELLNHIVIPASVEYVGERAFAYCTPNGNKVGGLTDLTILSDNITFAGTWCVDSTGLQVAGPLGNEGSEEYNLKFTWTTKIPDNAFNAYNTRPGYNKMFLGGIILPEGLEEVGNGAFASVSNSALSKLELPNTVTKIGDSAFAALSAAKIDIPSSVKYIGKNLFLQSDIGQINLYMTEQIDPLVTTSENSWFFNSLASPGTNNTAVNVHISNALEIDEESGTDPAAEKFGASWKYWREKSDTEFEEVTVTRDLT